MDSYQNREYDTQVSPEGKDYPLLPEFWKVSPYTLENSQIALKIGLNQTALVLLKETKNQFFKMHETNPQKKADFLILKAENLYREKFLDELQETLKELDDMKKDKFTQDITNKINFYKERVKDERKQLRDKDGLQPQYFQYVAERLEFVQKNFIQQLSGSTQSLDQELLKSVYSAAGLVFTFPTQKESLKNLVYQHYSGEYVYVKSELSTDDYKELNQLVASEQEELDKDQQHLALKQLQDALNLIEISKSQYQDIDAILQKNLQIKNLLKKNQLQEVNFIFIDLLKNNKELDFKQTINNNKIRYIIALNEESYVNVVPFEYMEQFNINNMIDLEICKLDGYAFETNGSMSYPYFLNIAVNLTQDVPRSEISDFLDVQMENLKKISTCYDLLQYLRNYIDSYSIQQSIANYLLIKILDREKKAANSNFIKSQEIVVKLKQIIQRSLSFALKIYIEKELEKIKQQQRKIKAQKQRLQLELESKKQQLKESEQDQSELNEYIEFEQSMKENFSKKEFLLKKQDWQDKQQIENLLKSNNETKKILSNKYFKEFDAVNRIAQLAQIEMQCSEPLLVGDQIIIHTENMLMNYSLIQKIKDTLEKIKKINTLQIQCNNNLYLDSDIKIPGVSIMIQCNTLYVEQPSISSYNRSQKVVIDTSGVFVQPKYQKKAKNGKDKRKFPNVSEGQPGDDGKDGEAGQNAGHIEISASKSIINKHLLALIACGADGQNGQDGGDGDEGIPGLDGVNAILGGNNDLNHEETKYWYEVKSKIVRGELARKGGKGGDGGLEGLGGEGGYRGDIIVQENGQNIVQSGLLGEIKYSNGQSGSDGEKGYGGQGGANGQDGKDIGALYCQKTSIFSSSISIFEQKQGLQLDVIDIRQAKQFGGFLNLIGNTFQYYNPLSISTNKRIYSKESNSNQQEQKEQRLNKGQQKRTNQKRQRKQAQKQTAINKNTTKYNKEAGMSELSTDKMLEQQSQLKKEMEIKQGEMEMMDQEMASLEQQKIQLSALEKKAEQMMKTDIQINIRQQFAVQVDYEDDKTSKKQVKQSFFDEFKVEAMAEVGEIMIRLEQFKFTLPQDMYQAIEGQWKQLCTQIPKKEDQNTVQFQLFSILDIYLYLYSQQNNELASNIKEQLHQDIKNTIFDILQKRENQKGKDSKPELLFAMIEFTFSNRKAREQFLNIYVLEKWKKNLKAKLKAYMNTNELGNLLKDMLKESLKSLEKDMICLDIKKPAEKNLQLQDYLLQTHFIDRVPTDIDIQTFKLFTLSQQNNSKSLNICTQVLDKILISLNAKLDECKQDKTKVAKRRLILAIMRGNLGRLIHLILSFVVQSFQITSREISSWLEKIKQTVSKIAIDRLSSFKKDISDKLDILIQTSHKLQQNPNGSAQNVTNAQYATEVLLKIVDNFSVSDVKQFKSLVTNREINQGVWIEAMNNIMKNEIIDTNNTALQYDQQQLQNQTKIKLRKIIILNTESSEKNREQNEQQASETNSKPSIDQSLAFFQRIFKPRQDEFLKYIDVIEPLFLNQNGLVSQEFTTYFLKEIFQQQQEQDLIDTDIDPFTMCLFIQAQIDQSEDLEYLIDIQKNSASTFLQEHGQQTKISKRERQFIEKVNQRIEEKVSKNIKYKASQIINILQKSQIYSREILQILRQANYSYFLGDFVDDLEAICEADQHDIKEQETEFINRLEEQFKSDLQKINQILQQKQQSLKIRLLLIFIVSSNLQDVNQLNQILLNIVKRKNQQENIYFQGIVTKLSQLFIINLFRQAIKNKKISNKYLFKQYLGIINNLLLNFGEIHILESLINLKDNNDIILVLRQALKYQQLIEGPQILKIQGIILNRQQQNSTTSSKVKELHSQLMQTMLLQQIDFDTAFQIRWKNLTNLMLPDDKIQSDYSEISNRKKTFLDSIEEAEALINLVKEFNTYIANERNFASPNNFSEQYQTLISTSLEDRLVMLGLNNKSVSLASQSDYLQAEINLKQIYTLSGDSYIYNQCKKYYLDAVVRKIFTKTLKNTLIQSMQQKEKDISSKITQIKTRIIEFVNDKCQPQELDLPKIFQYLDYFSFCAIQKDKTDRDSISPDQIINALSQLDNLNNQFNNLNQQQIKSNSKEAGQKISIQQESLLQLVVGSYNQLVLKHFKIQNINTFTLQCLKSNNKLELCELDHLTSLYMPTKADKLEQVFIQIQEKIILGNQHQKLYISILENLNYNIRTNRVQEQAKKMEINLRNYFISIESFLENAVEQIVSDADYLIGNVQNKSTAKLRNSIMSTALQIFSKLYGAQLEQLLNALASVKGQKDPFLALSEKQRIVFVESYCQNQLLSKPFILDVQNLQSILSNHIQQQSQEDQTQIDQNSIFYKENIKILIISNRNSVQNKDSVIELQNKFLDLLNLLSQYSKKKTQFYQENVNLLEQYLETIIAWNSELIKITDSSLSQDSNNALIIKLQIKIESVSLYLLSLQNQKLLRSSELLQKYLGKIDILCDSDSFQSKSSSQKSHFIRLLIIAIQMDINVENLKINEILQRIVQQLTQLKDLGNIENQSKQFTSKLPASLMAFVQLKASPLTQNQQKLFTQINNLAPFVNACGIPSIVGYLNDMMVQLWQTGQKSDEKLIKDIKSLAYKQLFDIAQSAFIEVQDNYFIERLRLKIGSEIPEVIFSIQYTLEILQKVSSEYQGVSESYDVEHYQEIIEKNVVNHLRGLVNSSLNNKNMLNQLTMFLFQNNELEQAGFLLIKYCPANLHAQILLNLLSTSSQQVLLRQSDWSLYVKLQLFIADILQGNILEMLRKFKNLVDTAEEQFTQLYNALDQLTQLNLEEKNVQTQIFELLYDLAHKLNYIYSSCSLIQIVQIVEICTEIIRARKDKIFKLRKLVNFSQSGEDIISQLCHYNFEQVIRDNFFSKDQYQCKQLINILKKSIQRSPKFVTLLSLKLLSNNDIKLDYANLTDILNISQNIGDMALDLQRLLHIPFSQLLSELEWQQETQVFALNLSLQQDRSLQLRLRKLYQQDRKLFSLLKTCNMSQKYQNNKLYWNSMVDLCFDRFENISDLKKIELQGISLKDQKARELLEKFEDQSISNFFTKLQSLKQPLNGGETDSSQNLLIREEHSTEELLKLLTNLQINKNQDQTHLKSKLDGIHQAYNLPSDILTQNKKIIRDYLEEDIKQWVENYHGKYNANQFKQIVSSNFSEVVAVIARGVQIQQKVFPRNTQLLAIILYHSKNNYKGILGQISTGEGKSIIVAMLAILLLLMGHKVDIITSSKVLAERDAKEVQPLFNLFNYACSCNCDEKCESMGSEGTNARKERYDSCHVIYGEIGTFQRDLLMNTFYGEDVLRNRTQDAVIVDEVDSMLLDKSDTVLYLSHHVDELKHMTKVFFEIWDIVCQLPLEDIYEVDKAYRNQVVQRVCDQFQIRNIPIPSILHTMRKNKMRLWAKNAIVARQMQEGGQYKLERDKGKITIMDNETGVEQANSHWSEGLHIFLELKHEMPVSQESLKAVFISNIAYLQLYSSNMYGLSGTLGSTYEQKLLSDIYNLEFFQLPRYCEFRLKELIPKIAQNQEVWKAQILKEVKDCLEEQRPLLLLCQDLRNSNIIAGFLDSKQYSYRKYDSSYQKISMENICPCDIIVATNIAGRGTDLKLSQEAVKNGGLHVLLAFMPNNMRIKQQAIGRAARKGDPGSYRFIILAPQGQSYSSDSSESENSLFTFDEQVQVRNEAENMRLVNIEMEKLPKLSLEQDLFKKFTDFYLKTKQLINSEQFLINLGLASANQKGFLAQISQKWEKIKKDFNGDQDFEYQFSSFMQNYLVTQWALWLDNLNCQHLKKDSKNKQINREKIQKLYRETFEQTLQNKFQARKNLEDMVEGCEQLNNLGFLLQNFGLHEKALRVYEGAIEKDSDILSIYQLEQIGHLKINLAGSTTMQKKAIINVFDKEIQLLDNESNYLAVINERIKERNQQILQSGIGATNSPLESQVTEQIVLIGIRTQLLKSLIGQKAFDLKLFKDVLNEQGLEMIEQLLLSGKKDTQYVKPIRLSKKLSVEAEGTTIIYKEKIYNLSEYDIQLFSNLVQLLQDKISQNQRKIDSSEVDRCYQDNFKQFLRENNLLKNNDIDIDLVAFRGLAKNTAQTLQSPSQSILLLVQLLLSQPEESKSVAMSTILQSSQIQQNSESLLAKLQALKLIKPAQYNVGLSKVQSVQQFIDELIQCVDQVKTQQSSDKLSEDQKKLLNQQFLQYFGPFLMYRYDQICSQNVKLQSVCQAYNIKSVQDVTLVSLGDSPQSYIVTFDYEKTEEHKEQKQWEKKSWFARNWGNVFVIVLGAAQIAVGAMICVGTIGFGSSFAVDLVMMGMQDIWQGGSNIYKNQRLDWKEYAMNKAISVAMSVVSFGLGKMVGGTKLAQEVILDGATQLTAIGGRNALKKMTWSQIFKLHAKAATSMGKEIIKSKAKSYFRGMVTDYVMEKTIEFTQDKCKSHLASYIKDCCKQKKAQIEQQFSTYQNLDESKFNEISQEIQYKFQQRSYTQKIAGLLSQVNGVLWDHVTKGQNSFGKEISTKQRCIVAGVATTVSATTSYTVYKNVTNFYFQELDKILKELLLSDGDQCNNNGQGAVKYSSNDKKVAQDKFWTQLFGSVSEIIIQTILETMPVRNLLNFGFCWVPEQFSNKKDEGQATQDKNNLAKRNSVTGDSSRSLRKMATSMVLKNAASNAKQEMVYQSIIAQIDKFQPAFAVHASRIVNQQQPMQLATRKLIMYNQNIQLKKLQYPQSEDYSCGFMGTKITKHALVYSNLVYGCYSQKFTVIESLPQKMRKIAFIGWKLAIAAGNTYLQTNFPLVIFVSGLVKNLYKFTQFFNDIKSIDDKLYDQCNEESFSLVGTIWNMSKSLIKEYQSTGKINFQAFVKDNNEDLKNFIFALFQQTTGPVPKYVEFLYNFIQDSAQIMYNTKKGRPKNTNKVSKEFAALFKSQQDSLNYQEILTFMAQNKDEIQNLFSKNMTNQIQDFLHKVYSDVSNINCSKMFNFLALTGFRIGQLYNDKDIEDSVKFTYDEQKTVKQSLTEKIKKIYINSPLSRNILSNTALIWANQNMMCVEAQDLKVFFFAYRGTFPLNLSDVYADIFTISLNMSTYRFEQCLEDSKRVFRQYLRNKVLQQNYKIFCTGHSLGGYLAEKITFELDFVTQCEAFNSGTQQVTIDDYQNKKSQQQSIIISYHIMGDTVSDKQLFPHSRYVKLKIGRFFPHSLDEFLQLAKLQETNNDNEQFQDKAQEIAENLLNKAVIEDPYIIEAQQQKK